MEAVEEYDPALLDDHPLRSYPRECCPGLQSYSIVRNVKDLPFRILWVLLVACGLLHCLSVISDGFFDFPLGEFGWAGSGEGSRRGRLPYTSGSSGFAYSSRCIASSTNAVLDPIHFAMNTDCVGVKADIWLHHNEILVGSSLHKLDSGNTLRSRYLDPLMQSLQHWNDTQRNEAGTEGSPPFRGMWENPQRAFVLILNFRTTPASLWPPVVSQLSTLMSMGYLTHISGSEMIHRPVTVVATGRVPIELVTAGLGDRYIFVDASLDELVLQGSSPLLAHVRPSKTAASPGPESDVGLEVSVDQYGRSHHRYCASAHFAESIGHPRHGQFSREQLKLIRQHVRTAHEHGLKARYFGIPGHRRRMRNLVWRALVREGVDMIDLDGSSRRPLDG
jgi:hypothetical protein